MFQTLSHDERFRAARYILGDEEMRRHMKIPNEITLEALSEDRDDLPVFNTIDEFREDLLWHKKKMVAHISKCAASRQRRMLCQKKDARRASLRAEIFEMGGATPGG